MKSTKPTNEELQAFQMALEQNFRFDKCSSHETYVKELEYGSLLITINYTTKREFKNLEGTLTINWDSYYRKFPSRLELGTCRELNMAFVAKCESVANTAMNDIQALLAKLNTITKFGKNDY